MWWASGPTPVAIVAAQTGVTLGNAAQQPSTHRAALHHRRHRRGPAGGHRALEHRRLEAVDDRENELGGHLRMRRPAYFSPSRRRPPNRSHRKNAMTRMLTGGTSTDEPRDDQRRALGVEEQGPGRLGVEARPRAGHAASGCPAAR